jgi:hypothetical protein
MSSTIIYGEDGREFIVNEDGIALGLPRNEHATQEARACNAISLWDWIKGPCVIVPAAPAAPEACKSA